MVQSTSIVLFASVALLAASPAFGAVLPNNKPASTTTTSATTTSTGATTKPTPGAWRQAEEMRLFEKLERLEGYQPKNNNKNLKKDVKSTSSTSSSSSSSSSTATPTGKLASGKPIDRLAEKKRLDKLRDEKLLAQEKGDRLKMAQLKKEMDAMDRERLSLEGKPLNNLARPARPTGAGVTTFGTAPTPAALNVADRLGKPLNGKPLAPSVTGPTATALPTGPAKPQRQNLMNQADRQKEENRLFADLERLVENKATREVEEVQWVRGYDNSENDARDYDDEDVFAREDDEDVYARDFDDEEAFSREDLEDLEFALRELDNDEDVFSRFDFEGLEDLD